MIRALTALLLALAFFFGVGTSSLRRPGLQYDEAYDAVPALEVLDGRPPSCADSVSIFGVDLPLMMHSHIGPFSAYTSLASFALLGRSVESLRLGQLAVGAMALILLFLLARAWFDDRTAAIAVLLCGTAPAFLWWSRGGANWTVPLLPLALGMLLALSLWWKNRRPGSLALAALLCGLGITTKILFVWLAAPMLLTGLLAVGIRPIWTATRRLGPLALGATTAGFLVGLAPMIAHNIPEPHTLHHILGHAVTTDWGHDNREFLSNLRFLIGNFLWMIDGETLMAAPFFGSRIGRTALLLAFAYGVCRVASLVRSARRDGSPAADTPQLAARTFLLLVPVTVIPQGTVSTSTIGATYLFIIVPFTWLLVATFVADAASLALRTEPPRWQRLAGGIVASGTLLLVLWSHTAANVGLLRFFEETGGRGYWSDAVDRVADALEHEYAGRPVVAMGWGFGRNVTFLTDGRIRVIEGHEFAPTPSAHYSDRCRALLDRPESLFLVRADRASRPGDYFDVFRRTARSEGFDVVLLRTFHDGEGSPHTLLYEVTRTHPGPRPPP